MSRNSYLTASEWCFGKDAHRIIKSHRKLEFCSLSFFLTKPIDYLLFILLCFKRDGSDGNRAQLFASSPGLLMPTQHLGNNGAPV